MKVDWNESYRFLLKYFTNLFWTWQLLWPGHSPAIFLVKPSTENYWPNTKHSLVCEPNIEWAIREIEKKVLELFKLIRKENEKKRKENISTLTYRNQIAFELKPHVPICSLACKHCTHLCHSRTYFRPLMNFTRSMYFLSKGKIAKYRTNKHLISEVYLSSVVAKKQFCVPLWVALIWFLQ